MLRSSPMCACERMSRLLVLAWAVLVGSARALQFTNDQSGGYDGDESDTTESVPMGRSKGTQGSSRVPLGCGKVSDFEVVPISKSSLARRKEHDVFGEIRSATHSERPAHLTLEALSKSSLCESPGSRFWVVQEWTDTHGRGGEVLRLRSRKNTSVCTSGTSSVSRSSPTNAVKHSLHASADGSPPVEKILEASSQPQKKAGFRPASCCSVL